jgi:hypothetical protein
MRAPRATRASGTPQPRVAEERGEPLVDLAADDAAVPVEPDDDGQEEPERQKSEPEELGMLPSGRAAAPPHLLDAGGHLRAHVSGTLPPRHG